MWTSFCVDMYFLIFWVYYLGVELLDCMITVKYFKELSNCFQIGNHISLLLIFFFTVYCFHFLFSCTVCNYHNLDFFFLPLKFYQGFSRFYSTLCPFPGVLILLLRSGLVVLQAPLYSCHPDFIALQGPLLFPWMPCLCITKYLS